MAGRDQCYTQGLVFYLAPSSGRLILMAARITRTLSDCTETNLTIKILLISTALLALSIFMVTVDRFSSLLTPLALYIGVATVIHAIALNFESHSLRKTAAVSLWPSLMLFMYLPRFLPIEYQNFGSMGQFSVAAFLILLITILYVLFARITEDH